MIRYILPWCRKITLQKITETAKRAMNIDTDLLYNAPTLVIPSATEAQLSPNIEYANAACVTENMLLAATDKGIDSVFLWGAAMIINGDEGLRKELNIPSGNKVVCSAAFGYAVEPNVAEKELQMKISVNWA